MCQKNAYLQAAARRRESVQALRGDLSAGHDAGVGQLDQQALEHSAFQGELVKFNFLRGQHFNLLDAGLNCLEDGLGAGAVKGLVQQHFN